MFNWFRNQVCGEWNGPVRRIMSVEQVAKSIYPSWWNAARIPSGPGELSGRNKFWTRLIDWVSPSCWVCGWVTSVMALITTTLLLFANNSCILLR